MNQKFNALLLAVLGVSVLISACGGSDTSTNPNNNPNLQNIFQQPITNNNTPTTLSNPNVTQLFRIDSNGNYHLIYAIGYGSQGSNAVNGTTGINTGSSGVFGGELPGFTNTVGSGSLGGAQIGSINSIILTGADGSNVQVSNALQGVIDQPTANRLATSFGNSQYQQLVGYYFVQIRQPRLNPGNFTFNMTGYSNQSAFTSGTSNQAISIPVPVTVTSPLTCNLKNTVPN